MYEQLNPCLAQQYKYTYQQAMPVEQLVRRLADNKQYSQSVSVTVLKSSSQNNENSNR